MPSKNVHIVTVSDSFSVPNDPSTPVDGVTIDVALELSKKYGRSIRQGNSFRLIGYGLSLRVPGQDTGAAATANLTFVEPNRHLVKAWNNMFQTWRKQKQIQAKVGRQMRYDDFEVCLTNSDSTARTSVILDDPFTVADGDPQKVMLTGNSSEATNFTSIADVYNSRFPTPASSRTHYDSVIKECKFGDDYIDTLTNVFTTLQATATASGHYIDNVVDGRMGGIAMADMVWLPADNHINVMCGLVNAQIRAFPEDTGVQIADTLEWQVTLVFEGWSPLADGKKGGKN